MIRGASLVCTLLFLLTIGQAQDQNGDIAPYNSVIGNLASGGLENWTFSAVDGEVVSLVVESTSQLDPVVTVLTEAGAVLASQDDYDYANTRDALIQSLTIPYTGNFTVQVSSYGSTAGSYRLTRLRGYAGGADLNSFAGDPNWTSTNDSADIAISDDGLTLTLNGVGEETIAINDAAPRLDDFYAHTQVNVITGREGWVVSMTYRQQSTDRYYQASFNQQGLWRLTLQNGTEQIVLRDWISHPAIIRGETSFNLGILANDSSHEIFYNGSLLGTFSDETLSSGVIGLSIGTAQAVGAETQVSFEDLFITIPMRTANDKQLLPSRIIINPPNRMAQDLQRRRLIPTAGQLSLNVPESSSQSLDLGVTRLPLGRGTTYQNFVISTEVTINAAATDRLSGCGLFFRATDDTNYMLAFIDQVGGYGLAERQGEGFLPGIFGERQSLGTREHHLLVIVKETTLYYYIDGILVGELEASNQAGSIGNAVINYEENNTTCLFQNTWVWNWDNG